MTRCRAPIAAAGLAVLALAACETPTPPAPSTPSPPARPAALVAPAPQYVPSALSQDLARYYHRVETSLTGQGLLRTEGGGADTPFNARQLAENFIRVALYEEYAAAGDRIVAQETRSRLHRWELPVRMEVNFGDSVPPDERARDRATITTYAARLARITDHPVEVVRKGGNFHIFIVDEDERRALGPRLRTLVPDMSDTALSTVINLPRTSYCLVFALDPGNNGTYREAVAIIRSEHPDLLRLSCIHEELAQGMGLSNDSPSARPSIFNDDEEFGLLTRQDELMLKMLYDPRLRPGMSVAEARPIVEAMAKELVGE